MRISIIVPVHNSMMYLDECIMSVVEQMGIDDEIILIENGSTDRTPEKCQEYTNKYSNIRYFELGNVGVSVARNYGLKVASGEWIVFLDSDDQLQHGAFDIVEKISNKDIDVILAGYSKQIINEANLHEIQLVDSELLAKGVLNFAKYYKQIEQIAPIDSYNNWSCWGKFYKRKFLLENGIEFPEGVAFSEDAVFCFQVYCLSTKIYATRNISYFYRLNPFSVTQAAHKNLVINNEKVITALEKIRNENQCCINWEKEFSSFYAGKIIEIFLSGKQKFSIDEKRKIQKICNEVHVKRAIKNASYFHLIMGKKNMIRYCSILFLLKIFVGIINGSQRTIKMNS